MYNSLGIDINEPSNPLEIKGVQRYVFYFKESISNGSSSGYNIDPAIPTPDCGKASSQKGY
jgi:hypothetical protein